ncbi:MAG: histidine kinase [Eubacteriales bacterium]|nr:histidine kinase [Eubacteriales bacterium]
MRGILEHRSVKLFSRLMAVLLFCMVPVCGLSLFSNFREQIQLKQTIIEAQERNASYYLRLLEQEVSRLKDITYAYMNDDDFMNLAMMYDHMSDYARAEATENVRAKLKHIHEISPYANTLYLYLPTLGRSLNTRSFDYELDQEQIRWYMERETLSVPVVNEAGQLMILSYYPASATIYDLPEMMLGIELKRSEIRSILREASQGAMLIGDGWNIWTEPNVLEQTPGYETLVSQITSSSSGMQTIRWMDEQCLFVWKYSSMLNATILTYIPQNEVLGGLRETQRFLWMLLAAAIIMLTGTAFGVWHMVHMPMRRIVDAFREVENGNNDVRLTVSSKDEFQYLYSRFNHMMSRLNSLIQQVYTQRILSQQAQLKQLQMQINPHFFYNSFFAIRGMIEMGDHETAMKMLSSIGNYFRYITRSARDSVPLKEEVAHARDYCEIQKVRFESIQVIFDPMPEELADFEVPRLILQPLIENCYLHGLESKESEGILKVYFENSDVLLRIVVEDNGGHMDDATLAMLSDKLRNTNEMESTGMINIHRRLQLFYGEQAGLSLYRNSMDGLTLVVTIPKGGRTNVQTSDC